MNFAEITSMEWVAMRCAVRAAGVKGLAGSLLDLLERKHAQLGGLISIEGGSDHGRGRGDLVFCGVLVGQFSAEGAPDY